MEQKNHSDKSINDTTVKFGKISIDYYGVNQGAIKYITELSNLELIASVAGIALDVSQTKELERFIWLSADGLLSVHPNMSKNLLEDELFNKLQIKYSRESWWRMADFSRLIIDNLEIKPREVTEGILPTEKSTSAVEDLSKEIEEIIYTVEKGDTLWSIIEKQFTKVIKELPAGKRMEVLDRLFDRIEGTLELKLSLNLRSGDDTDLIYPNEKINLTAVAAELEKILGSRLVSEDFKKSAALAIDSSEDVKEVPIKVATLVKKEVGPVIHKKTPETVKLVKEEKTYVTKNNLVTNIKDSDKKEVEIILPPKVFKADGNFFEHTDYQSFIIKTFGGQKAFSKILKRAVEKIDDGTYDLFNKGIYDSPFDLLKDMSLAEVQKFQELPNAEVRGLMKKNNIKYDTYLAWLDLIDEMIAMSTLLPQKSTTTISDLFSRYIAESESARLNKFKN